MNTHFTGKYRHESINQLYLVSLLLESLDSSLVDILEKQDLDFLSLEGSQDLWLGLAQGAATSSWTLGLSGNTVLVGHIERVKKSTREKEERACFNFFFCGAAAPCLYVRAQVSALIFDLFARQSF